jgi:hypothetical protein
LGRTHINSPKPPAIPPKADPAKKDNYSFQQKKSDEKSSLFFLLF